MALSMAAYCTQHAGVTISYLTYPFGPSPAANVSYTFPSGKRGKISCSTYYFMKKWNILCEYIRIIYSTTLSFGSLRASCVLLLLLLKPYPHITRSSASPQPPMRTSERASIEIALSALVALKSHTRIASGRSWSDISITFEFPNVDPLPRHGTNSCGADFTT